MTRKELHTKEVTAGFTASVGISWIYLFTQSNVAIVSDTLSKTGFHSLMTFLRLSGSRCTQATISYIQAFRLQCDGRRLLGHRSRQLILPAYRKNVHLLSTNSTTSSILHSSGSVPSYCPGCGARSQTSDKSEAGHYSLTRSAVKSYLGHDGSSSSKESEENAIFASALQDHRKDVIQQASAGAQPIQSKQVY